ncbi:MAG: hypothetical protein ACRC5H_02220, partial [Treponemataceae bacterium]
MDDKSFYERLFSFAGNKLKLHTGFSQKSFAKEKLFRLLDCKGCVISHQTYSGWKFKQIFSEDDTMILEGDFALSFSLFSLVMDLQKEIAEAKKTHVVSNHLSELWLQFSHFFDCYYKAIAECKNIPACGLPGIHFSANNEILFLPHEAIEKPLQCDGDERYSSLLGCWTTPQKPYENSHYFFLANILYFVFAGKLAYQNKNTEQRLEDYIDSNFTPIEFEVDINENIALWINSALAYGEKTQYTMDQNELEKILHENLFLQCNSAMSKRREKMIQKKKNTVEAKRFMRRNTVTVAIVVCVIAIACFVTLSIRQTQKNQLTTEGLSIIETVSAFYYGIQHLRPDIVSMTLTKDAGKKYKDFTTNFYVITQLRKAYEGNEGFFTPQEWNNNGAKENEVVYGIARLFIAGHRIESLKVAKKEEAIMEEPFEKKITLTTRYLMFIPQ